MERTSLKLLAVSLLTIAVYSLGGCAAADNQTTVYGSGGRVGSTGVGGAAGGGTAAGTGGASGTQPVCVGRETRACQCSDGRSSIQACFPDGSRYGDCACGSTAGVQAGAGGTVTTTTGAGGSGAGGRAGSTGVGGAAGSTGAGGSTGSNDLEEVRQACVDEINRYRATESLPALARAPANVETCSDAGAKNDAEKNIPHDSAGSCTAYSGQKIAGSPLRGGQNACPGWPVGGGWGGYATLKDAILGCLKAMWEEKTGFVSSGKTRAECQADYQGCFLKYGHYLNMNDTGYKAVSSGFYDMGGGKWWMNQDF